MRFILAYKYGILQTKTERIDVNFCENTGQLLEYLEKRVGQSAKDFIVRIKKPRLSYRIVRGWPLSHYGLKQGTELNIEILEQFKVEKKGNQGINSRYVTNVLGVKPGAMDAIEEVKENETEEASGQFSVRKYLDSECELMLKAIQRCDLDGFLDIFQDFPEVQEEDLVEIQTRKPLLIDELGEKGWGALHYAIFCEAKSIFNQLLDMEADVNKCTSDGWLPLQLSINLKERYFMERLLAEPTISLNLVTTRGSPLHMAARQGNKQMLGMLLEKEVDITLKDNSGMTPLEVCSDEECIALLKRYEQKKETYQEYVKGNLPLSLTTIVRGTILKAKRPFMTLKERYLLIDPFQGSLIRYENASDFPRKPKQITPLSSLDGMRVIEADEKSWHMKKQLFYFQIQQPNKEIYACKYLCTAQKWLTNIKIAVRFAQELEKNPLLISEIKRNEVIIEDKEGDLEYSPKKVKKNIFNLTSSARGSRVSQKSVENIHPEENGPIQSPTKPGSEQVPPVYNLSDVPKVDNPAKQQTLTKELNSFTSSKVNFSSFSILNTLGSGAFGKVFLAKLIDNGKLYALKALKKKNLILQKQLKYAIIEANILKQANHQFIINLHFAFQTPHYLYLALDYCPGRDLSFHLARQVTFPEEEARFYIAELCLAIEHLHLKNIVYRDLKPENILLDAQGHVKLADFGLSKQTSDDKTKSFCGSPAYLSPEMLSQKGAGKESDLYGIGAVLYEFLIGEPPYFSDDIPTLYRNIREGKLKFPKNVSEHAKSFITGLLQRDPKRRLGVNNWSQIKDHPFFQQLDWSKLLRLQIPAPVRPEIDDEEGSQDELDIIKNNVIDIRMQINNFTDFDYDDSTRKINRLMNFSFARAE